MKERETTQSPFGTGNKAYCIVLFHFCVLALRPSLLSFNIKIRHQNVSYKIVNMTIKTVKKNKFQWQRFLRLYFHFKVFNYF